MSKTVFYKKENISDFFQKMDSLGKDKTPFLFAVNYEQTEAFLCESPTESSDVLFAIGKNQNSNKEAIKPDFRVNYISKEEYKQKFDIIQDGLKRGNSFLANLTIKTPIETNLTLKQIFDQSRAPYRICIPEKFVCFSPERFVKISGDEIFSNPMKGTISTAVPDALNIILTDFKETAEHSTIVDLIRNDLSMVAENVKVKRFRYVDTIAINSEEEILQVSSEIVGKLPQNKQLCFGSIVRKLLPAGSICGAPKRATVELIQQAEQVPRGFYTGVFGYFDGEIFDSAVMIRFIEKREGKMYFRSGGGITAYSNCESEYEEMLTKIYLPFQ